MIEQYAQLFPSVNKLTALAIKMTTPLLIEHYSLQSLVLDMHYVKQDTAYLLEHLSSLAKLTLLNLKEQVTLSYLETVHQACPQLTNLFLDSAYADPRPSTLFDDAWHDMKLVPCHLHSFSLSCQSGASKWALWLPYFALKYPHLRHLSFKNHGTSVSSGLHHAFCEAFRKRCRYLRSIRWDGIAVHGDQAKQLYQPSLRYIHAHENFSSPKSIFQVPIIASLITRLSLHQVKSTKTIELIGSQCGSLNEFEIQHTKSIDGLMQVVLAHCPALTLLKMKHTQLTALTNPVAQHTCLNRLVIEHCSFKQGLFEAISTTCTALRHVDIIACFQSDTRGQVRIDLSHCQLETLKINALRARHYYPSCRIRFFALNQHWFHMNKYSATELETALELSPIDTEDVNKLLPLVTEKLLKAWDIEYIKQQAVHTIEDVESLYYSGLVSIQCSSVKNLFINNLWCNFLNK
ncbi:hypothetical protein A0J61_01894 [Choanephora cucurbitarum]|uniref:SCF E3 ubiquitin ligase complex F-box protein grrA n=1 Tax=Choanephora cucurbitarum TaxID=101091 RepID=A0A1C7NS39_9FUNG|nr:hypothetical protein A0J61_01894 [Choanephora cucurbitarum]